MPRISLALCLLILARAAAPAQSVTRKTTVFDDASRAIAALSRLDNDVIVYGSLGEFEENQKLATVSLPTFEPRPKFGGEVAVGWFAQSPFPPRCGFAV